jgi:acyl dehydratase
MKELEPGSIHRYQRSFSQEDFNRFAALSGDDNPIHVDPGFAARTRFGKTVAHGMLLYSALSGYLGAHFPGPEMIPIYQEMTFHSPTYVGERVNFEIWAEQGFSDAGMLKLSTQVVRPNGESGLVGKCLLKPAGISKLPVEHPVLTFQSGELPGVSLKGMVAGQSAVQKRIFSNDDLKAYISISGDENPLITDLSFARELGFKGFPLPGGLLGSMFSHILGTKLPGRGTNWLKQTLHFPAPAYLNEEITARVEIVRLRPEKNLVNLRTYCTNSAGNLVCDGEALVLVKDLEQ